MAVSDNDRLACLSNRLLHLILMPTEQCNFRCTYCFEDYHQGRMESRIVTAVKRLLDRRVGDLDHLLLDWYGGEPTLALDIVQEIQEHAVALSREYPQLELGGTMTTNAYHLDRDQLSRLLELGIRSFQIAVDGPPELHDVRRVTAGGRGTFARIWANLVAAGEGEEDFEIIVRYQVDEGSPTYIRKFLELYEGTFASDERFQLAVVPLNCFGTGPEPEARMERAAQAAESARRGARVLGLNLREGCGSPPICYASRAHSFVVRADGTLGKCTVTLGSTQNRVGRLLDDGRVELDTEKFGRWIRGIGSGDETELRCPVLGYTTSKSTVEVTRI